MSDEDTELKDLLAQTLEANGVMSRIRAELRAQIFLALEDQVELKTPNLPIHREFQRFLSTRDGLVAASLIRDFLAHFRLEFSLAVLTPETGFTDFEKREDLARDLHIVETEQTRHLPLLCQLLKKHKEIDPVTRATKTGSVAEDKEEYVRIPKELTATQIAEARAKFDHYDADHSGSIEKDELRQLFADMFPNFHRNMLERYVNDEFRAVDKDFSNAIDFEEFLGMYKRLFVLCRSVVSHDISDIVVASPRKIGEAPLSKIPSPVKKVGSNNTNIKPSAVETKNKKNAELNKDFHNTSFGSDPDDEHFFDDAILSAGKPLARLKRGKGNGLKSSHIPRLSPTFGGSSEKPKDNETHVDPRREDENPVEKKPLISDNPSKIPKPASSPAGMSHVTGLLSLTGDGGFGSLKNAPPLPGMSKSGDSLNNTAELQQDLKAIDNKIAALGFDLPDDDEDDNYEDDFASSGHSQTASENSKSVRSERNDRSHKSDKTQSVAEDIEEDIEEDISLGSQSGVDDMTTDHTISQHDMSGDFDYMEDVLAP